jgi:hypothetical protein
MRVTIQHLSPSKIRLKPGFGIVNPVRLYDFKSKKTAIIECRKKSQQRHPSATAIAKITL